MTSPHEIQGRTSDTAHYYLGPDHETSFESYFEPSPDADAAELDAWDDHIHSAYEQGDNR
jgi:hypothetical protein